MGKSDTTELASGLFGPAVKALLLCLFVGGSGLGYTWQKGQIEELGHKIKEQEARLEELRRHNKNRVDAIQQFVSPFLLDQKAAAYFPELTRPGHQQVVTLWEPRAGAREQAAPVPAPAVPPVAGVRQFARASGGGR